MSIQYNNLYPSQSLETAKYENYSCVNPMANVNKGPWFPRESVCPCNQELSSPTGRGHTNCPFGINQLSSVYEEYEKQSSKQRALNQTEQQTFGGAMFPLERNVNPSPYEPRPMARIGIFWRN